jgi:hypothetical protein
VTITITIIITTIAIIIAIIASILHQMQPAQLNRIVLQPNDHMDPTMMMTLNM